jgi:hypothetical protein
MTFVGQFPLPGTGSGMAFLFVSDDEERTFLMDGGENALLVQPGGRVPPFVRGEAYRAWVVVWQRWTTEEIGESWRFFFQMDGADGWDDDAYKPNFGGGSGYVGSVPQPLATWGERHLA